MTQLSLIPQQEKPVPKPTVWPYPPVPTQEALHALLEEATSDLMKHLTPQVEAKAAPISTYRYREDQEGRHLEFLAFHDDTPAGYRVTRRPDATLEQVTCGQPTPRETLACPDHALGHPEGILALRLARALLDRWSPDRLAPLMGSPDHARLLRLTISQESSKIVERLQTPDHLPDHMVPSSSQRVGKFTPQTALRQAFNKMVRDHLVNPDAASWTRKRFNLGSTRYTPDQYNRTITGTPEETNHTSYHRTTVWTDTTEREVREAAQKAKPTAPRWTPVQHIRNPDGSTALKAMTNPGNPPQVTVTRSPDGCISVDCTTGEPQPRLNLNNIPVCQEPIRQMAAHIAAILLRDHSSPEQVVMNRSDIGPEQRNEFTTKDTDPVEILQREALRLLGRTMLPQVLPGRSNPITDPEKLPQTLTRLARRLQADPEIIAVADSLRTTSSRPDWNLTLYNNLARNNTTLQAIAQSSPAVFRYYQETILPKLKEDVKLQGPGQVVDTVRQDLDLPPDLWKWFIRTQGLWPKDNHHRETREQLALTCTLLRDANHPSPEPEKLKHLLHNWQPADDQLYQEGGPKRAAWVTAVNRFLHPDRPHTTRDPRDLRHVADAIIYHFQIQPDLPWGPADWNALVARADTTLNIQLQNTPSRGPELRWESAIMEANIGEYRFTALTSTQDLEHWGNRMDNCLPTYANRCDQGNDRIFIAHDQDGNLTAAVQLNRSDAGWHPVQLEGPRRSDPGPSLRAASQRLAREYDRTQQKLDQENQNREHPAETQPHTA